MMTVFRFFLALILLMSTASGPGRAQMNLALPRHVGLSPSLTPAVLRGMTIDPKNPFAFEFLVDPGESVLSSAEQSRVYAKLVNYFLAALTIADDKQWVNLSPYEGEHMIDVDFGKTEMGRDLLAQDYVLKQLSAGIANPNGAIGREFWKRVQQAALAQFKTTQMPINAFNKVWIVPASASMHQSGQSVFIVDSHLKVLMDEDYVAVHKNRSASKAASTEVFRATIVPQLEREVNQGQNFAPLRQMYQSMLLATWYK